MSRHKYEIGLVKKIMSDHLLLSSILCMVHWVKRESEPGPFGTSSCIKADSSLCLGFRVDLLDEFSHSFRIIQELHMGVLVALTASNTFVQV